MLRLLALHIAAAFSLFSLNNAFAVEQITPLANPDTMVVRYSEPGNSDVARFGYQYALMHLILEETREEFGGYTIETYRGPELSIQRYAVLLNEGVTVNVGWGPPGSLISKSDSTPINIDIFHNLLGYRICLTNKNGAADLASIKSLAEFRRVKVGQGVNWADIPIYAHNEVTTVAAPTFESLFQMLTLNRFDCLALGANEVQNLYREKKDIYPALRVDEHLLLYYSFPIYFYVSNKTPKLIARIKSGLNKIQKNGEHDRLFIRHHGNDLESLNLKNRNIICLKSPYLPTVGQCSKPIILPEMSNKYSNQ
ncbi:MAG: hypothetical protein V4660_06320 [Pseudomonadota bacterium]